MKKFITTLSAIMLTLTVQQANAFGPTGHRTVANIAQQHLTVKAQSEIEKIIGKGPLARLATWPDSIRSDNSWRKCSQTWHYISVDDDEVLTENIKRDKRGDILAALKYFEAVLSDKKSSKKGRQTYHCKASESAKQSPKWQALAFFVHFVGDIHQPLHVGRRDDRGGNDVEVKWFKDDANIHKVWDSKMLDLLGLSYTEYTEFLNHPKSSDVHQWQSSNYLDWAKESKSIRSRVYDFGQSGGSEPTLSWQYAYKNQPVLDQRVLKAGVRLAGKLNHIFR
jgi:hypothetical protein